jgi:muramoyltetrapeptide carboxypeptidase LdcA involved in peptidoglycan recycling
MGLELNAISFVAQQALRADHWTGRKRAVNAYACVQESGGQVKQVPFETVVEARRCLQIVWDTGQASRAAPMQWMWIDDMDSAIFHASGGNRSGRTMSSCHDNWTTGM